MSGVKGSAHNRLARAYGRLNLAACVALLSGCDSSKQLPPPHPADICARADPFARALERGLASAAAVAASDRPVGDGITRYPVTVTVVGLLLHGPRIIGDDGKSVECSARWRATVTITPSRPLRILTKTQSQSPGRQVSIPHRSPTDDAGPEISALPIREEKYAQPLNSFSRIVTGNATSYRALWEPPRIWVYGDLGMDAASIASGMLGQPRLIGVTERCVLQSNGEHNPCLAHAGTTHRKGSIARPS